MYAKKERKLWHGASDCQCDVDVTNLDVVEDDDELSEAESYGEQQEAGKH